MLGRPLQPRELLDVVVGHELQPLHFAQEVSAARLQVPEERLPLVGPIDPRRPGAWSKSSSSSAGSCQSVTALGGSYRSWQR